MTNRNSSIRSIPTIPIQNENPGISEVFSKKNSREGLTLDTLYNLSNSIDVPIEYLDKARNGKENFTLEEFKTITGEATRLMIENDRLSRRDAIKTLDDGLEEIYEGFISSRIKLNEGNNLERYKTSSDTKVDTDIKRRLVEEFEKANIIKTPQELEAENFYGYIAKEYVEQAEAFYKGNNSEFTQETAQWVKDCFFNIHVFNHVDSEIDKLLGEARNPSTLRNKMKELEKLVQGAYLEWDVKKEEKAYEINNVQNHQKITNELKRILDTKVCFFSPEFKSCYNSSSPTQLNRAIFNLKALAEATDYTWDNKLAEKIKKKNYALYLTQEFKEINKQVRKGSDLECVESDLQDIEKDARDFGLWNDLLGTKKKDLMQIGKDNLVKFLTRESNELIIQKGPNERYISTRDHESLFNFNNMAKKYGVIFDFRRLPNYLKYKKRKQEYERQRYQRQKKISLH